MWKPSQPGGTSSPTPAPEPVRPTPTPAPTYEPPARAAAPTGDQATIGKGLVIKGERAADLLAKGSALDLHPKYFPVGACGAAGYARLRTILWKTSAMEFELLVGRSYARSLWEWLIDAAAEYGCVSNNG